MLARAIGESGSTKGRGGMKKPYTAETRAMDAAPIWQRMGMTKEQWDIQLSQHGDALRCEMVDTHMAAYPDDVMALDVPYGYFLEQTPDGLWLVGTIEDGYLTDSVPDASSGFRWEDLAINWCKRDAWLKKYAA